MSLDLVAIVVVSALVCVGGVVQAHGDTLGGGVLMLIGLFGFWVAAIFAFADEHEK